MRTSCFVIVEKASGLPLRLKSEYNGKDRYACGEYRHTLVSNDHSDLPLFQTDTADKAMEVLTFNQEWYNSSADHPMLGEYEKDQLAIYVMETKLTLAEVGEPLVIGKGVKKSRSLPYIVAKRIAPDSPKDKPLIVAVFNTADAEVTEAQLREKIGHYVYFDKYDRRILHGVAQAREEWREFGEFEIIVSSY